MMAENELFSLSNWKFRINTTQSCSEAKLLLLGQRGKFFNLIKDIFYGEIWIRQRFKRPDTH